MWPPYHWPENELRELWRHGVGATEWRQSLGELFILSLDSQVYEPMHLFVFNCDVQLPATESFLNDTITKFSTSLVHFLFLQSNHRL